MPGLTCFGALEMGGYWTSLGNAGERTLILILLHILNLCFICHYRLLTIRNRARPSDKPASYNRS